MLADEGGPVPIATGLREGIHLPATQFRKLIDFVAALLPRWRDDHRRTPQSAENRLSEQLCDFLDDETRNTPGFEIFKFQREPHDDAKGGRNPDIAAKPAGTSIWIEGRHYSPYDILLPIECKRLPTPTGPKRDPREYLYNAKSSTGGIQRFKAGDHAKKHTMAAMIGYVQSHDISHWEKQVGRWVNELVNAAVPLWSDEDSLVLESHDTVGRCARLTSTHARCVGVDPIALNHLWIEMSPSPDIRT